MHVVSTLKRGGIEVFVTELLRRSERDCFGMSVCCLSESRELEETCRVAGAAVFHCQYTSPDLVSLVLRMARLFRQQRVDVVHSHVGAFTAWVALAGRLAGVQAVVGTYHNTYRYPKRGLAVSYLWLGKLLATRQTAVSRAVSDWFEVEYGLRDLEVLYLGVDTEKYVPLWPEQVAGVRAELGISSGAHVVGTVCALSVQKDLSTFLRAARHVVESLESHVYFLVIGDGVMRAELERFAQQLDLNGTVVFLGVRSDVERLIAAMDVFVLTSRWEGLPITVLEAQSSAVPIVASRLPGICEALIEGETALLADVGKDQVFADLILRLLRQPELARSLGRNGRKLVLSRFRLDASLERHKALYFELGLRT